MIAENTASVRLAAFGTGKLAAAIAIPAQKPGLADTMTLRPSAFCEIHSSMNWPSLPTQGFLPATVGTGAA